MMEWISVKDKLPEKHGHYFVVYKCHRSNRIKSSFCLWDSIAPHSGWRSREQIRRDAITHWMPIPKPPNEE